jgi:hypothetical protein
MLRALVERLAIYVPFVLSLGMALWMVSGALHAQSTDAIFHAFSPKLAVCFWR